MHPPADFHHIDEDFCDEFEDAVFIEESDIIEEIPIDEEDLPDAEDEDYSPESYDVADDSVQTFTGHNEDEVYAVACSPVDPSLVATGGGDNKGFLWGIGQGDRAFELTGHTDSVCSLCFSTDGQLLASGDFHGRVNVWDVASKTLKRNLKSSLEDPEKGVEWVRWHPTEHLVLAGSEKDCVAVLWDVDHGDDFGIELHGHGSGVRCGDFTLDFTLLNTSKQIQG